VNQPKLRMFISDKGRGICTAFEICQGHAVCEYIGKEIVKTIANDLGKQYEREGKGSYIFYVKNQSVCLDATAEDGTPGRLINHSLHNGNLKAKMIKFGDSLRIFFVAIHVIPANTELLYDYGERAANADSFLHESPVPSIVSPSRFEPENVRSHDSRMKYYYSMPLALQVPLQQQTGSNKRVQSVVSAATEQESAATAHASAATEQESPTQLLDFF
jgi:hypothetical protein